MKFLLWVGLPLLALLGLSLAVPDVASAWQAKSGDGTAGTFIARYETCGRNCTWHGDFVPDEGGTPRSDVIVYDGPDELTAGATVAARDTGARRGVFAAQGGSTWLLFTGLAVAGALAAIGWVVFLVYRISRTVAKAWHLATPDARHRDRNGTQLP
ncbi:hypothetical protein CA850_14760 [Micromonospora echinospora]|uniref:Transmembrane protein n=2 Tax=Micromonospora echinospora TaxID=1877 RepID=A0A1C4W921_MICEC|nr:hypothetical protein CA850_14760 [Micromonospora echinospora]SCE92481.1 hypothetical protein GA0070618_1956 [Micromonospora echinospora]